MDTFAANYFGLLHGRRSTARRMMHRVVRRGEWIPERSQCHANVDAWVRFNPALRAVRGWMILCGDEGGRCNYIAHSVVGDAHEFGDITLADQAECDGFRFLEHVGAEDDFWLIENNHRQVFWPPLTAAEAAAIMTEGPSLEDSDDGLTDNNENAAGAR